MADDEEVPLAGGYMTDGVVRVGDTVRRPMRESSPAVHALLEHLEAVGFDGAPRVMGIDDRGREILTYQPGTQLLERWAELASDQGYARFATLVAGFHRAAESFVSPPDAVWSDTANDPKGGSHLLHGDLGPWNVIAGDDRWVIIDWDGAAPGRLEWELAYVLLVSVPFFPGMGLSDAEVVRRVRVFADAYGMSPSLLDGTLDSVIDRCLATLEVMRRGAAAGSESLAKLLADGQDALWVSTAKHLADALPRWRALLSRH